MIEKQDTYKHKGLRKILIDSIREKGISDEKVLQAMTDVPRHFFLDMAFDKIAYEDRAFPIGEGQTISQPYTVAYQTQLLEVKPTDKILEIGTGSVYQATILAAMGARVYTIERQRNLYKNNLIFYPFKNKYKKIQFFFGDGYKGLAAHAPFDKIIITAAIPQIPDTLLQQLKVGGILVAPVGSGDKQTMTKIVKTTDNKIDTTTYEDFVFVPMLAGKEG